jgi:hypothetical protein
MGDDDEHHEHARKDIERARKRRGVPFSLKKIVSYFFFVLLLLVCLLNVVFIEIDTEYRYQSFMEAHPAHNYLPAKARLEAMDVLTWAWTGKMAFFYSLRARLLKLSPFSCP